MRLLLNLSFYHFNHCEPQLLIPIHRAPRRDYFLQSIKHEFSMNMWKGHLIFRDISQILFCLSNFLTFPFLILV